MKYSDLYEAAPLGYLTLDEKGNLLEANLTLAQTLETENYRLIGRALADCLAVADREAFHGHLQEVFKTGERQNCDVRLQG